MEVHKWSGWKRIHNKGNVMEIITMVIVVLFGIWCVLEYYEVGKDSKESEWFI